VHGRQDVLQWALLQGARSGFDLVELAAASGQLAILKWLVNETAVVLDEHLNGAHFVVYQVALRAGHLQVAEWLLPHVAGRERAGDALACIGSGGHLHVVRWLHRRQRIQKWELQEIAHCASVWHNLEMLRWLRRKFKSLFSEFLMERGENCLREAVRLNDLEQICWLYECGVAITLSVVVVMALHDREDFLTWAREVGAPWDHELVMLMAGCHSLACLEYLREQGVPWPSNFFERAVKVQTMENHVSCYDLCSTFPALEFAIRNGAEWHGEAMARVLLEVPPAWQGLRSWIEEKLTLT
jgi:hypothetical protein